jgi:antitoxin component YwqK of YwqJK toxin-antitoxin module
MTPGDEAAGGAGEQLHEHVERHRDGSLRARGPMLGDEPHGAWEWFRLDGTMLRSGSFDRGAQVGEWTTYDRQGRPYKVTRLG